MLQRHNPAVPAVCEVCEFAVEHGLDVENEHALVRLATHILIGDLAAMDGGPAALQGLAVSTFPPVDRGPQHEIAPRHWYWALYFEPRLKVSHERVGNDGE